MSNPATGPDLENDFGDEVWSQRGQMYFYFAIIVAAAVLLAYWMPRGLYVANAIEEWTRDFRIAVLTPNERVNEDIVVVTITEESLAKVGAQYRSPVDRGLLADIILDLENKGARAIGLDIVLDSPTEIPKDAALRNAIKNTKTILVQAWSKPSTDPESEQQTFLNYFARENQAYGYPFVGTSEFDGTVRNFRPRFNFDGEARLHFAAKLAEELGAFIPPLPRIRIAWHGQPAGPTVQQPFRTFPAHELKNTPSNWFNDKVVLVGLDLPDIDRHRTPYNTQPDYRPSNAERMPGVLIHAHILSQLMKQRTGNEARLAMEMSLLILFGLLGIAFPLLGVSYFMSAAGTVLLSAGWIALAGLIYSFVGFFLPVLGPLVALVLSATMGIVYMAHRYRTERHQIRSALARYMPPEIVSRLEMDPNKVKLGNKKRVISVMFTDMEGFTALTETLDTEVMGKVITDYLDGISRCILKRDGTIDKYLGDGTMSFFGAPESSDEDADKAVKCALEIRNFTEAYRKRLAKQNIPVGRTRIGIHTGEANVGNFGGRERFDYTALGDTVNTAARLESAGKLLPATVLVSEDTKRACQTSWFRPAGKLHMPGKNHAIVAYEPLPMNDAARLEHLDEYLAAYGLLDQGHPNAKEAFSKLVEKDPEDALAAFHLKRLEAGETQSSITLGNK